MSWTMVILVMVCLLIGIDVGHAARDWEWKGWDWCYLSSVTWIWWWPRWLPDLPQGRKQATVRVWNLFNRRCADGQHWWGVGLLQVGRLHLAYLGNDGRRFLFLGGAMPG